MKRANLLPMMCLVALVAFNFSSCSNDDDDKENKPSKSLIGAWANDKNPYKPASDPYGGASGSIMGGGSSVKEETYIEDFLVFDKDGTAIEIIVTYDKNMKQKELYIEPSTYKTTKNGFKMTYISDPEDVSDFYAQIDGESMTLNKVGDSETGLYHRIDRSEIEKYLTTKKETGNPEDIIGAWSNWYAQSVGNRVALHVYDYKDNGTFRDYTIWFKNNPDNHGDEFAWNESYFEDFEFIGSEYEEYQWKADGCMYYQVKKGQKNWDVALYSVDKNVFNFYSWYDNKLKGLIYSKQFFRMDEGLFADFVKNAKKHVR